MENTDVFPALGDFMERMRQPSAGNFVKSIKSFIVSFSKNAPDPDTDCNAVQEFFSKMEAAFRAHPPWSGCSKDELNSAGDGLEKYVMARLFTRVFASNTEDVISDEKHFQKMSMVQQFISPENLDIQPTFQNKTSWLLAQKELQKINMYKAPRDKLMCILSCCKVINGADKFLPVLIYVTIKANPPQFHSNLLYIQRYMRRSKLVGETAYFFTNLLSAVSFISNIDAKSLMMDEAEFEYKMHFALLRISRVGSRQSDQTPSTQTNSLWCEDNCVDMITFFDLEFKGNQIVEFGGLKVCTRKLKIHREIEHFVTPDDEAVLYAFSDRGNGLNRDSLLKGHPFLHLHPRIFEFLEGAIWVGHNIVGTDIPLLNKAYKKIKRPPPRPRFIIDTYVWLKANFGPKADDMTLDTLGAFFSLSRQVHRSLPDCILNLEVFKECSSIVQLGQIIDQQTEEEKEKPDYRRRCQRVADASVRD